MDAVTQDFLFQLLNTPSPTGFEIEGQRKWAAYARNYSDSVENDAYGNTWAALKGAEANSPRVMIEAHADEIGFIIKYITKEGWLRIDRIGGSDIATARGRRIDFLGERGLVPGVIGNTAVHLRPRDGDEKTPKVHELYVDVGASSPEEVAGLGLRVGTPGVYQDKAQLFGENRIVGRALDNRLGSFILTQVLRQLSEAPSRQSATVLTVNAVQEEIGGNGAQMVTHRLKPDLCICLDVTHATESPGIEHAQHGECKLGGGPSITHGTANHPLVIKGLLECAGRLGIPVQHESSSRYSGTDTDVIFTSLDGIPSALVSLPLRYMHSVVEMADRKDIDQVVALVTEFVRSVKRAEDYWLKV